MDSSYSATSPGSRDASGTDPGSVDNRLSLDPNNPEWTDLIADWEDGKDYTVNVTITQLSPGEFEVKNVTEDHEEDETHAEDATQADSSEGESGMMKKPNRAVKSMMSSHGM